MAQCGCEQFYNSGSGPFEIVDSLTGVPLRGWHRESASAPLDRSAATLEVLNIAIILALLLAPYLALLPLQVPEPIRARIGILSVFAFTGVGHFIKTEPMSRMLPPWTPMRVP